MEFVEILTKKEGCCGGSGRRSEVRGWWFSAAGAGAVSRKAAPVSFPAADLFHDLAGKFAALQNLCQNGRTFPLTFSSL